MSKEYITIAIDGPAGAGKSTIAKAVAKQLGILHLDTGAMYRAMALMALQNGLDPSNAQHVLPLLSSTVVYVENHEDGQHTFLNGKDVSNLIRTQEVSKGASDIGVFPEVRKKLAELQREIGKCCSVVMDGREIGTFVMPGAKFKFYVTASVQERACRRLKELQLKGEHLSTTQQQMEEEIAARDHTDSTREFAPLRQAEDAVVVDTTYMDIDTAIQTVMRHIRDGEK